MEERGNLGARSQFPENHTRGFWSYTELGIGVGRGDTVAYRFPQENGTLHTSESLT